MNHLINKEFIKNFRINMLKITQKEFAKQFGVCKGCVSSWERGQRNPSKSAIILLKKIINDYYKNLSKDIFK
jgi:DNA-binding transcriptional regulator YiaG